MNNAKTILSAGLIASPAFFATATTVSEPAMNPGTVTDSVSVTASNEETATPLIYRPETDDPTVQFPLVVVDNADAYKTWCAISDENDEPFAVVAPLPGMSTADFLKFITGMTDNFEVDAERVYLVVNDADSPLISNPTADGIFATQITVDYTTPIPAETVATLLSSIRE